MFCFIRIGYICLCFTGCIYGYFRYMDGIFIICNKKKNIEHTFNGFSKLQSTVEFTIETELHNSSFLDLTIHYEDKKLKFSMYRKPTQTDVIIPNSSCPLCKHKLSSISYLLNKTLIQ
jgi:hypothetical protein